MAYLLLLNPMRDLHVETMTPVAQAATSEALLRYLNRERSGPYEDGRWQKTFRAGGPLEWFNAPFPGQEAQHIIDVGSADDAANPARQDYAEVVDSVPDVSDT